MTIIYKENVIFEVIWSKLQYYNKYLFKSCKSYSYSFISILYYFSIREHKFESPFNKVMLTFTPFIKQRLLEKDQRIKVPMIAHTIDISIVPVKRVLTYI